MVLHPNIRAWLSTHSNHITTQECIECGVSKTMLTRYVKAELLTRVDRGLYILPGTKIDEFYQMSLHSGNIVFSHESALYLYGLISRIPQRLTLTVPADTSLRKEVREQSICHYVERRAHSIGKTEKVTRYGHTVLCYDLERTVCDFVRCRSRYSDKLILDVLQVYFGRKGRDIARLAEYASILGVTWALEQYMDALR